jgi:hypothetical protein
MVVRYNKWVVRYNKCKRTSYKVLLLEDSSSRMFLGDGSTI